MQYRCFRCREGGHLQGWTAGSIQNSQRKVQVLKWSLGHIPQRVNPHGSQYEKNVVFCLGLYIICLYTMWINNNTSLTLHTIRCAFYSYSCYSNSTRTPPTYFLHPRWTCTEPDSATAHIATPSVTVNTSKCEWHQKNYILYRKKCKICSWRFVSTGHRKCIHTTTSTRHFILTWWSETDYMLMLIPIMH